MIYSECPLYGLKSKKMLKHILQINDNRLLKQEYVASLITPYLDKTGKPRLIESPNFKLKAIQNRIRELLGRIKVPDNVFSGIKGRSYVDNVILHTEENLKNIYKIDLTAFFPSVRRETVYRFFYEELLCSADVAAILTNLTTIDIERKCSQWDVEIEEFLRMKGVTCKNHLITGAPTSPIMSYLVNYRMFDEMQKVANDNGAVMTVYIDDVTFSAANHISRWFKNRILSIVRKYGYIVSRSKVKTYTKDYPKVITGVVIDSRGNMVVKNSMRKRILDEYKYLRTHSDDEESRFRLKGLLSAARQIEKNIFPSIYRFVYKEI